MMITAPARGVPILKLRSFEAQATVSKCYVNTSGDHDLTFPTAIGLDCTSTALEPALADVSSTFLAGNFDGTAPTTQTFGTGFDNWDRARDAAAVGNWIVVNGGDLDVTFNVTDKAFASELQGGIDPFIVRFTPNPGYVGRKIGQLVWTQAIYNSNSLENDVDLDPPDNRLDSASGDKFIKCAPLPGQHPGPFDTSPGKIGPGHTAIRSIHIKRHERVLAMVLSRNGLTSLSGRSHYCPQ